MPGGPWAIWRWICLRGAGFPADLPQQLAASDVAAAADRFFSLQEAAAERIRAAIAGFRLALDNTAEEERRNSLHRALKQLHKAKIPGPTGSAADLLAQEAASLISQAEEAKTQFTGKFQSGVRELSARIRKIALDPWFRQAMLLQNRAAFRRVAHSFSAGDGLPAKRGFKERQNEELIASYLQRYCLKNDTIGFFGPVGWAKIMDNQDSLVVEPGSSLVASSSIYFENWCIEALAEKMSAINSLRPWIAPRLLPFFRVDGPVLHSPGTVSSLSPLHAAILQRCNGELTAREIARAVIAIPECGVRTEGQVYGILQTYASQGTVSWKFEIPYCLHPEKKLRELLEKIEKQELRKPLLDELTQLERCREKISRAVGDAEQMDQALEELDAAFTQLTGRSPTKSAGAMYAARTLVYQDCRRSGSVEIGKELLSELGAPLTLLLTSARWFSHQTALTYREYFCRVYEELAGKNNQPTVDLLQFWARIEPLIFDPVKKLFNEVMPEFQNRWEAILQVPWDESRVEYQSAKLKPLVENLFAVPHAGWQLARYHSPDVMIAASSVEEIRSGNCLFVLGEVHMAANTLRFSFALSQHDQPDELFEAIQADLPQTRAVPVPPRHWPRITNRTSLVLVSPQDRYVEISGAPANGPRAQTVPISAFRVEKCEGSLIARSWDGSLQFEIIEFLGEMLSSAAIELLKIVRARPHVPRISIDKLVVARESWSFSVLELDFIHPDAEHERFLQARRWMRLHRLPRFVFVRVPVEVKPFYLDFESPVYVEIFIKMVRRMLASAGKEGRVTLTEMLPVPEQAWLQDAQGRTYTSELRMVAWDLMEHRA
jgi:hypothetical protein